MMMTKKEARHGECRAGDQFELDGNRWWISLEAQLVQVRLPSTLCDEP